MSDSPKIFTTHLREMTERYDPRYHDPVFADNLRHIQQVHWCALRQCCELSEETWDKGVLFPDQFPYIEISAIDTESGMVSSVENYVTEEAPSRAQLVVRSGDILVSMTRPTRNAIAKVPDAIDVAIASTGFSVVRAVDTRMVSSDYLFHVLRLGFCTMQFDQRSSGGNYPAITKADLLNTIIPVPPLDVQNRIVAELDAAYETKRKADEKAAQLLASIDDIVLSELGIPKLPPQDTSLEARMFMVSSKRVADSTLAPKHYFSELDFSTSQYPCIRFSDVIDIDPTERSHESREHCPFVPMENVSAAYGLIEQVETITGEQTDGYSVFRNGDVIWAKITPCMENGKSAVVETGDVGLLYGSTEFMVFRPRSNEIISRYLHSLLRLKWLRDVAAHHFSGSAGHQRVTTGFFKNLMIPVPPCKIQEKLVAKVNAIYEKAKSLKSAAAEALTSAKSSVEVQLLGGR